MVVGRGFSNVNTPFSFVPCCKDQEDFGDKPVIDLSRLNIKGLMRGRGLIHPVTASTDVWQLILDAVKGYDLAVSFDPIK